MAYRAQKKSHYGHWLYLASINEVDALQNRGLKYETTQYRSEGLFTFINCLLKITLKHIKLYYIKMTFGRYKRLLLVLFAPLLIIGSFIAYYNYSNFFPRTIYCLEDYYCEDISFEALDKSRYDDRFYYYPFHTTDKKATLSALSVVSSPFRLIDISLLEIKSFSSSYPSDIAKYLGKKNTILLKESRLEISNLHNGFGSWVCETMFYLGDSIYGSSCLADGWRAEIKFEALGNSRITLDKMRDKIIQTDKKLIQTAVNMIVIDLLAPLFIFLTMSLTIYGIFRAYRYVSNG